MIRYTKISALILFLLLGSFSYAQQETGVTPVSSTVGNEVWYYIESAYTGTANVPESLVGKHFVLYSPTTDGFIKYRQSQGTDDELWAIVGTGTAARLKNKATGKCMVNSHSVSTAGDTYTYTQINGDQFSMISAGGGSSKTHVWTNYTLNRSTGTPTENSIFAFRFIPANDATHLTYVNFKTNSTLIKLMPTYAATLGGQKYQYVKADMKGLATKSISLVCYNNEIALTKLDSIVISVNDVSTLRKVGDTYEVPVPANAGAFRVKGIFAFDNSTFNSLYWDNDFNQYSYWTDMIYTYSSGYGALGIDRKSATEPLILYGGQTFAKGFGLHGPGNVQSTGLSGYSTFKVNVGKLSGQPYVMGMTLKVNGESVFDERSLSQNSNVYWETNITGSATVRIDADNGTDNSNGNDYGIIGAPRFYLTNTNRQMQTINWTTSQSITALGSKRINLNATASSGGEILYSIVSGSEYATIENNNTLVIPTIPASGTIVVKALQCGNDQYLGTSLDCTFTLESSLTVQNNETVDIPADAQIKYLTVYGDKNSAGQVRIPNGLATIEQYRMIYTFNPNEWTYIAFPANGNIDSLANFRSLGYEYNTSAQKRWELKEFTGTLTDQSPTNSFPTKSTPEVIANKGYMIRLIDTETNPVEVTFLFNNKILDMSGHSNKFNLRVDLSSLPVNGETIVAISPKDQNGNTLTIKISYDPIPQEDPMDYNIAAANARFVTFDNDRRFRIPLPNRQFANIYILNSKASKVLRSIKYQSPASVDISKLKTGTYPVVLQYGNAFVVKELIIDRK